MDEMTVRYIHIQSKSHYIVFLLRLDILILNSPTKLSLQLDKLYILCISISSVPDTCFYVVPKRNKTNSDKTVILFFKFNYNKNSHNWLQNVNRILMKEIEIRNIILSISLIWILISNIIFILINFRCYQNGL